MTCSDASGFRPADRQAVNQLVDEEKVRDEFRCRICFRSKEAKCPFTT